MTTKANSTVSLKTSQGDVRVKKGKLILIKHNIFPEIGTIGSNEVHPLFMWTNQHKQNCLKLVEYKNTQAIVPIIISETDEIENSHMMWDSINNHIVKCTDSGLKENILSDDTRMAYHRNSTFKILAMPTNFSPKHLQAIVDGKMKNGDEVYVQCKRVGYQHMSADFVDLDSNNHVTLHKVEQKMYTKEELIATLHKCHSDIYKQNTQWSGDIDPEVPAEFVKEIDDWAAQNL